MNLEIHRPELMQRMNAQLRSRRLRDALDRQDALDEEDALDEKFPPPPVSPQGSLHEFFMNSPLRGANLDLERVRDYARASELE